MEEAERLHPGIEDERRVLHPELAKPFGGLYREWELLKARIEPGDELWTFESPPESWRNLAGRAGVALVRNGKVMSSIVTIMN